jgi:protein Jumonji
VNAMEKIHEVKNKVNAEELECNYCRANLHISWIKLEDDEDEESEENNVYCLKHALKYINDNRIQAGQCRLMYTYTMDEIEKLIKRLKVRAAEDEAAAAAGQSSSSAHDSQRKSGGGSKPSQKGKSTGK